MLASAPASSSLSPIAGADSTCFCTYDIRAIVNDTFNEATYTRLGQAFALWLQRRWQRGDVPAPTAQPWIALGYDARVHSPQFSDVLTEALVKTGLNVLQVGMGPSPLVYFAEHYSQTEASLPTVNAAVVVTASHNPAPYNGAKFTCNGLSISADDLLEMKAIFEALTPEQLGQPVFGSTQGTVQHWDPIPAYLAWSQAQFGTFKTAPTVVLDSGNGTAGVVAPQLLRLLGCKVVSLFEEPDGTFPNHHPDPCQHKNLQPLMQAVIAEKADLGVAFDGDSDRLGVIDAKGRIITGDFILLLYALDLLKTSHDTPPVVVSEVKCSQHLFDQINAHGGQAVMSPTGHAYIKNAMKQMDALLGGELSGHMFFRDKHWGFDDAIYAALRLVALLDEHRHTTDPTATLATLTEALPQSFLSEEGRVHLERDARETVLANLLTTVEGMSDFAGLPITSVATTDGIRLNLAGGFWLVRLSNTEPCLTLRAEATSPQQLAQVEAGLVDLLNQHIVQVLPQWTPEQGKPPADH